MRNVRTKLRNGYSDEGPFTAVLKDAPASIGRVLDQSLLLGNLEFTVTTLAEGTSLTYKTVKSCLDHLQKLEFVTPTRRLGNAQAYRFNIENHMSGLLTWATEFQRARIAYQ